MITRSKKVRKYRGSKTHGGGSKKKRRGAGNRGGRGMAGSGKRADQKKPSILKEYGTGYFGRFGFKRHRKLRRSLPAINVGDLNKFKEKEIDLKKMGYKKLLGKGSIDKKVMIRVDSASKKAIEKVKKSGGDVKTNVLDKKDLNEPAGS